MLSCCPRGGARDGPLAADRPPPPRPPALRRCGRCLRSSAQSWTSTCLATITTSESRGRVHVHEPNRPSHAGPSRAAQGPRPEGERPRGRGPSGSRAKREREQGRPGVPRAEGQGPSSSGGAERAGRYALQRGAPQGGLKRGLCSRNGPMSRPRPRPRVHARVRGASAAPPPGAPRALALSSTQTPGMPTTRSRPWTALTLAAAASRCAARLGRVCGARPVGPPPARRLRGRGTLPGGAAPPKGHAQPLHRAASGRGQGKAGLQASAQAGCPPRISWLASRTAKPLNTPCPAPRPRAPPRPLRPRPQVVYSKEGRKTPREMMTRDDSGRGGEAGGQPAGRAGAVACARWPRGRSQGSRAVPGGARQFEPAPPPSLTDPPGPLCRTAARRGLPRLWPRLRPRPVGRLRQARPRPRV
jgi:hypothetical protein